MSEDLEIKEGVENVNTDAGENVNTNAESKTPEDKGSEANKGVQNNEEISKLNTLADELGLGSYKELFNDNPEKFKNFLLAREEELFELGKGSFQADNSQGEPEDKSQSGKQDNSASNAFEKYIFQFNDEDRIDPKLRTELEKMNDYYSGVIGKLMSNINPVNGLIEEFNNMKTISSTMRFENALNGLGKDYESFIGKGTIKNITKEQKAFRDDIYDAKEMLREGYLAKNLTPPDEARLVEKAVRMVFADKGIDLAKQKVIDQAKSRQSQLTNKPNTRKSDSALSPEERAAKVFDDLRAKQLGNTK